MRIISLGLAVALLMFVRPSEAAPRGHQVRYVGIHPIPKSDGGGICYIEGLHVHIFAANKIEYRDHRGANHFVGDPVAYGYDGPRYAYKGHHPIHVDVVVGDDQDDVEFCYLDGPHYHYFQPVSGPEFKLEGDAYFYVAEPPPAYIEARPAMIKINAVYTPLVYARPVITVEPPSGWIGIRAGFGVPAVVVDDRPVEVVVPRGRAAAGVGVGIGINAGVEVHLPAPSLRVDIGIGSPGVIVRERPVYIRERGNGKHRGHRD